MRVAAVVLAAGRASRYRAAGGTAATKLVDLFRGEPLVRHAVKAALSSRAAPVLVVTGHAAAAVEAALAGLSVRFVNNAGFATGLASSLRTGLAALDETADAAAVLLGDMPLVTSAMLDHLIAAAETRPDAAAVVPVAGGVRGNPVVLRRCLFGATARLDGDNGARRLLRDSSITVLEVPVSGDAVRLDVDEPGGLAG